MKKLAAVLIALLTALIPCAPALAADEVTINVYNWGEYIDMETLEMFEEANPGIKVNYSTFDSNESMYSKVLSGAANYDVVIPSDYMIAKMIGADMLAELDFDNIPNYRNIGEAYRGLEYDPENKYSVPYTWGTVVVIYNEKYVDPADVEKESIELLWNEKYAGKILMFDNPRDAFGIALTSLGYSMNTTDQSQWREAADRLSAQKPLVQAYVMDAIFDKMESEEAWIAPYYAGDGLIIQEENENVKFYIPSEGTNMFVDAMCVLKSSEHKAEAEAFINFMCEPEIAALNADAIGYASPNEAALELIDPEIVENELIYTPTEYLDAHTEVFADLPAEIQMLQGNLWTSLKIQSAESEEEVAAVTWIDIFCILVVAIGVLGIVYGAVTGIRKRRLWRDRSDA